jgi:ribosomal protein L33
MHRPLWPLFPDPLQNRKNTPERLELMKFNPNLRRHTLHKEVK